MTEILKALSKYETEGDTSRYGISLQQVKKILEIRELIKKLEEEEKMLRLFVIDALKKNQKDKVVIGEYTVTLSTSYRGSKFDEDKVIEILKANNLNEYIVLKEVPKMDEINVKAKEGEFDVKLLEPAYIPGTKVERLDIKQKKTSDK